MMKVLIFNTVYAVIPGRIIYNSKGLALFNDQLDNKAMTVKRGLIDFYDNGVNSFKVIEK